MANEPKVLNVNGYQTPTEKVSGGYGTSSATVSSAPKELQKSGQSQVGIDLTSVKGTATGNTEERSLKVSKDATVGSYVADTNTAGDSGRTKRSIVNIVTVEDVKALIKKYGGGDSYSKEQIDEMLTTIREGQYVKVDTTEYPTLEDFLASDGEQGTVYLYPVGNEENNYYQYIWEVSEWVSLGTTQLDISNMVTTDTDQTISGVKTFNSDIKANGAVDFGNGAIVKKDSSNRVVIQYGGNDKIKVASSNTIISNRIDPDGDNSQDIGRSTVRWKGIYISGNLSDGTNSVSVADISNGLFNVINASDIVSNTLTQEQYDLITNGKPTIIKGSITISSEPLETPVILSMTIGSSNTFGAMFTTMTNGRTWFYQLQINNTTKALSIGSYGAGNQIRIMGLEAVNGKYIPAYPSNTGTYVLKYVNGTLTWVQE